MNKLFIISGPSGVGKTTVVDAAIKQLNGIVKVEQALSVTTRPPRDGEVHGKDYYFTEKAEFDNFLYHGDFVEYATVYGNYYGTLESTITEALRDSHIIKVIDWQGARTFRAKFPECIDIFIAPKNVETLIGRLSSRGTDSEEVINARLKESLEDLSHSDEFKYIIVNDDLDKAVRTLTSIITE